MKYLILAAVTGVVCFLGYMGLTALMDAKFQEGSLSAINAQTNTDLAHLTQWATDQQKINKQALDAFDTLGKIEENPQAGPNTSSALNWVRNTNPSRNTK